MALEHIDVGHRPWLLWVHDPCPEGGWHIQATFDSQEDAIAAAKANHERELRDLEEMRKDMPDYNGCYDGCMVTSREVFRIHTETQK